MLVIYVCSQGPTSSLFRIHGIMDISQDLRRIYRGIKCPGYLSTMVSFPRAHVEVGGGAWCPRQIIQQGSVEHLEIYLGGQAYVVTKVEVQGRWGNGQGREYTRHYKLQYWRPELQRWTTYVNTQGREVS